jgi:hypothetical protein
VSDGLIRDLRLRIFCCPDLGDPMSLPGPIPAGDDYDFSMNYNYVGGASKWTLSDPALSPIKPEAPVSWALMVDFVCKNDSQGGGKYVPLAHKERDGLPAGANHLFNDGHVQWVKWNGGRNMRTNTFWAWGENYIWRRTLEAP